MDASRGLYLEHRSDLGDADGDPVLTAAQIRVDVADELRQLAGRVCLYGALHRRNSTWLEGVSMSFTNRLTRTGAQVNPNPLEHSSTTSRCG